MKLIEQLQNELNELTIYVNNIQYGKWDTYDKKVKEAMEIVIEYLGEE